MITTRINIIKHVLSPLIKIQKATGESGAIQNTCGIYRLHLIKKQDLQH